MSPSTGALEHAEPISLFRLSEGAAQPACWLRVPSVHALRVCQRYASRDARNLRRELPAACNQTLSGTLERCTGEVFAEAHGAHTCETRSEVVILLCGSIPITQGHAYRPFAEHAGGGRRSVQSKRTFSKENE